MLRSMYSGVSGLQTHQKKMDVIGNNIANVNTVAFKSSSTTFNEIMYQNMSGASGATQTKGGVNAKQIGLGVAMASTTVNITDPGAAQTTGGAFDLAITGDAFFVVNNGAGNLFTKAGAFDIDGSGNLVMKSTGYYVMGWQAVTNEDGSVEIRKDTVSPLRLMTEANLTSPPEATTQGVCSGILDKNSTQVKSDDGYIMNLNFTDALGYSYTAKFAVKATNTDGEYTVELTDILNSKGKTILDEYNAGALSDLVSFGGTTQQVETRVIPMNDQYMTTGTDIDGNPTYAKRATVLEDLAGNYGLLKVPGFEDDPTQMTVTGTPGNVNARFSLSGGGYSKDRFVELYGMSFQNDTQTYYKAGLTLYDSSDTRYNAEDWARAMNIIGDAPESLADKNITNFEAKINIDGSVEISFDQQFETAEGLETYITDTGATAYRIPAEMTEVYELDTSAGNKTFDFDIAPNGEAIVTITTTLSANILKFDTDSGLFVSIAGNDAITLDFNDSFTNILGQNISLGNFSDISIDFTGTKRYDNGGSSTLGTEPGGLDGIVGKGKRVGELIGMSVSQDGTIWASYGNGNTQLIGQIAVATFPNPAGLEKVGENCFQTTLNSGDFDGIGQDITADGGKMTSGQLEMSNVDLASEFTEMITTQRGFQANSRIITTSDTLLEELINLKR